jgi:hypothetical protein
VDRGGFAIPGVIVTARASGIERTTQANTLGCFEFRGLAPASYRVTARLAGFDNVTRDNVTVAAAAATRVDLRMDISPLCDCVRVASPRTLAADWQQADAVLHVRIEPPPPDSSVQSGTYRHTVAILHVLKIRGGEPDPARAVVVEEQRNNSDGPYEPGEELVIFPRWNPRTLAFYGLGEGCCGNRATVFVVRDGRVAGAPDTLTSYVGMPINRFLDELRAIDGVRIRR